MLNEYVVTLNVAIICLTLLAALYLLRRTIDRVSKQKHTVFMLLLPFGITWMLAAGEKVLPARPTARRFGCSVNALRRNGDRLRGGLGHCC